MLRAEGQELTAKAKFCLASIIALGWAVNGREPAEKSGKAPCQAAARLVVRLVRHLASDLRKHVVGVAADQSDRANHDHQDYREHHRVFGDVLTALFSPKVTDCLDHCLPPNRRSKLSLIPQNRSSPSCDPKISRTTPPPNSTPVTWNGTIVPQLRDSP